MEQRTQRTLFPAHSPKLWPWCTCTYGRSARFACVDVGVGSSAADLCAQERQMWTNILAHCFPPSPSIGSISNFP